MRISDWSSDVCSSDLRIGNRQWAPGRVADGMNIWGRIEGERHRGNASLSTSFTDADTDTWKMQIGVDRALHEGANGNALVGGFTAHYGKANTGVRSFFGDGRNDPDAVGLGATLTWYSPDGVYADAQARFSWFSSDLKSTIIGRLAQNNDGEGQAFSMELGRSEEQTSELQSLMRISYDVLC